MAALGLLGSVSSLRYELAIPIPEENREATLLTLLSLIVVCVISILFGIVTFYFGSTLAGVLNAKPLIPYLWLLPIGYFLSGLYKFLNMWGIRNGRFKAIARTKLQQSVTMTLVQIAGAGFGPIFLLFGRVIGQASGIVNLGGKALRQDIAVLRTVKWRDMLHVAYVHRRFPFVSSWVGLASGLGAALPQMFLASIYGLATAGLFALTLRVMVVPMTIVGKAVGDVFYRQAPQAHREARLDQLVHDIHARLVGVALPLAVVLFLSIEDLFPIVFGVQWTQAGTFAMWMTPWMFMQFTTTPATRVFPVLDRHWTALGFQISSAIVPMLAIVISRQMSIDPVVAIMAMSACYVGIYLARLFLTYHFAGGSKWDGLLVLVRFAPGAVLCAAPLSVLQLLGLGGREFGSLIWCGVLAASLICCAGVIFFNMKRLSQWSPTTGED
jgi:O-antigen/teichoic acid export membrane protein